MSAFDKVIGYESIKKEFLQICDMIHNRDVYSKLGAKMPRGILLYGEPGLGKTLMAKCFIEECRLGSYTVRRNKGTDDFVCEITDTFRKAKANAPAIVFLEDLDKFANEDKTHCDAEEYVAVQAGIDEVKDSDVFVFATANVIKRLPDSLRRSGRFDRKIEVYPPSSKDACDIIKHYLSEKKVSEDVNFEDIAMMISYSSCAELENILNESAIRAAFLRKEHITMEDIVGAVLRMEYNAPDSYSASSYEDIRKIALHEAGHLVVCEVLRPGSVGLASLRTNDRYASGGFIRKCKEFSHESANVLVSLGGKAAVELYYSETCADGCRDDIYMAADYIRTAITESGARGLNMVNVEAHFAPNMSESMNARNEAVVHAELERYLYKARDILLKNREFLEKATDALIEKETLLYSDIKNLRESVTITSVGIF